MAVLIDSTLWVDFNRTRTPEPIKRFIAPYFVRSDSLCAEPIVFEIMRNARDSEVRELESRFQTMPMLATPPDLWVKAAALGQRCRRKGLGAGAMDLLISTIAIEHDIEVITFDDGFRSIAGSSNLKVKVLRRPTA